jgi:hypothetical protein
MDAIFTYLTIRAHAFADRCASDERGEVTEKVLITATFAALAIAAAAIIAAKVIAKANSIPTE